MAFQVGRCGNWSRSLLSWSDSGSLFAESQDSPPRSGRSSPSGLHTPMGLTGDDIIEKCLNAPLRNEELQRYSAVRTYVSETLREVGGSGSGTR